MKEKIFDKFNIILLCLLFVEIIIYFLLLTIMKYELMYYILFFMLLVSIIIFSIVLIIKNIKSKDKKLVIIPVITLIILIIFSILKIIDNIQKPNPMDMEVDKPVIYIYPEKKMDLKIKLGNEKVLNNTYPVYNNEWDVSVSPDGNIYDKKTKRNYYSLFWDAIDNTKIDMNEGFIVEGEDTIKFFEEKLDYLGLNERETEEFILYWLPQMSKNKYNYIRFRTYDEINNYMPLIFNETPDTVIRVIMDYKELSHKINIKEQKLERVKRKGFTVVEWGGRKLK